MSMEHRELRRTSVEGGREGPRARAEERTTQDAGGRLYLGGVRPELAAQLQRAGTLDLGREVQIVPADEILGTSTARAIAEASEWRGGARG
ncbi:MAG TPA: hypothetical protein VF048_05130, partial [Gemmatimonadaceae bacterium]